MSPSETLQMNRRFDGFRNTPFLWKEFLEELKMFATSQVSINDYPEIDSTSPLRLGRFIEQFVLYELEQDDTIQILSSNVQIFHGKRTIGELDCLLKQSAGKQTALDQSSIKQSSAKPPTDNIHLEIVYKFYLYDPSFPNELNRWIGPNRNDSLVLKLKKLKEKQLPLLHHPETAKLLNELEVKSTEFKQRIYFKAQLFVPLSSLESMPKSVNKDCITGFYIRPKDLALFTNHTYYIPTKLDWLVEPHLDVEWIPAQTFQGLVSDQLATQRSPLCWMKSPDGNLQKFFVVWWE